MHRRGLERRTGGSPSSAQGIVELATGPHPVGPHFNLFKESRRSKCSEQVGRLRSRLEVPMRKIEGETCND
jgi:hypothetical protein